MKPVKKSLMPAATPRVIRSAVYTRKSTEDGLEQEFNSLDAQREAGEAYVRSQAGEGWVLLPNHYDDGGYTGGNSERPGLKRLLADIEAGEIDCVVVYKVDRLSRSLLDFARMMAAFEQHGVAFVSVTQQFHTGTSMGRLMLNVLLSFAQFEREIISERTRDKIAATRKKGKWTGGHPVLGYDLDRAGGRLMVNADESALVKEVFALYLEHRALLPVVQELGRRGRVEKRWTTKNGRPRGGEPFDRPGVYRVLTNVLYAGKVRHKADLYPGEHPALVDPATFETVQDLLRRNGSTGGANTRCHAGSLLGGLLRCGPCGSAMTPTYTKKGPRVYRYYVCSAAQKRGRATCPSKSVPAGPVEEFVIDRVRAVGRDPDFCDQVLAETRVAAAERGEALEAERAAIRSDLGAWHGDLRRLATRLADGDSAGDHLDRVADLQTRIAAAEERLRGIEGELRGLARRTIPAADATRVLAAFDPVWATLTPAEQGRAVRLVVAGVEYDGSDGRVTVAFHPTGIHALTDAFAEREAIR